MKRFPAVIFISFLPAISFSQQSFFEYADAPVFNCGFSKIISGDDGFFYAVSVPESAWPGPGDGAFVYKTDRNGNVIFAKPFMIYDGTYLEDISLTPDSNLIVCGFTLGCDWFPSRQGLLIKMNLLGDTLWTRIVNPDTIPDFLDNHLRKVLVLNDGSLVTTADSTVYKTDPAGILQWKIPLSGQITSIGNALDDLFFIGTFNGLYTMDTTGAILSFNPAYSYYDGLLSDSTYLFSTSGGLVKTDTAFSVLSQFAFAPVNFPWDLIHIHHDTIWASGKYTSDFTSLDLNLNLLDTFRTQSAEVLVNSFSVFDTTIVVAGMETGQKNYLYAKSYSTTGNYRYYPNDLALIDVSFDTTFAVPFISFPSICYISFAPEILVQNSGMDTIHGFFINALSLNNGVCGPYQYHKWINASLVPGQSQSFVLDTLTEMLGCSIGYSYTFCCWVSCPDQKVDKNHSNDFLCDSFVVTEIVGIEMIPEENHVLIYPNPAAGAFTIKLPSGTAGAEVEIMTLLGEQVYHAMHDRNNITINANLKPGIYFVRVYDEDKISIQKLVAE